jgi:hypothetical protein
MPCCRKRLSAAFFLLWLLFASAGLQAADISARNPLLALADEGYVLSADFSVSLNARLEDAVARGVGLYFVIDFELSRSRWYWLDEQLASRSQSLLLSYHALTRQYRLSSGTLHQSFASLEEALRILSRLRNWQVFDTSVVEAGSNLSCRGAHAPRPEPDAEDLSGQRAGQPGLEPLVGVGPLDLYSGRLRAAGGNGHAGRAGGASRAPAGGAIEW